MLEQQGTFSIEQQLEQISSQLGVSRRGFMKFCTGVAATMGLSSTAGVQIAQAAANPKRPPVIWLSGQECTGCTESLLRSQHPTLENLILDLVSLDYGETLSTAAGHQAEENKRRTMEEHKGQYLLVIEGAIPTKDDGVYCKIAQKTILEHVTEAAENAAAIVAIGSCASWGGIPSSGPNPTGAKGAPEVLPGKTVVTIPGCPPNPYNFLATVLHFVAFGKLPDIDAQGRPKFAYGRLIHENCERRAHFNAGRFALEFGDDGHRKGWCLYKLGCKGPETYANCPAILFGDVGNASWPVGTGHGCFGCTEKGVGFTKPVYALSDVLNLHPPVTFPEVGSTQGEGVSAGTAALLAGLAGAAVGAGAVAASKMGSGDETDS